VEVQDDERSFEVWYQREHPKVFVAMLALSGDPSLAADLTDEAFARALGHWKRVSAMASPGGWTHQVAVNLLRRHRRRDRLERRLLRRTKPDAVTDAPAGEVWLIVKELPERQRLAVVLRYVADLSEPDIARTMRVTRGTVAATLAAARRSLGAALTEQPANEERS
jgi:RNA polymerase sigma-70 factor (ECF subfamily)